MVTLVASETHLPGWAVVMLGIGAALSARLALDPFARRITCLNERIAETSPTLAPRQAVSLSLVPFMIVGLAIALVYAVEAIRG